MTIEPEAVVQDVSKEDTDTAVAEAIRGSHPLLKGPVVEPRTDKEMAEEDKEAPAVSAEEAGGDPGSNGEPTAEDLKAELVLKEKEWGDQRRGITHELRDKDRALKETNARLSSIEAVLKKQAEPAVDPAPDPSVDPAGAAAYEARKAREEVGELRKEAGATAEQEKKAQLLEQWEGLIISDEEAFSKVHSDYDEAADAWTDVKISEARALGQTDEEIQESLALVDLQLAAHLRAKGVTLAEFKYEQAKVYGWKPSEGNGDEPAAEVPAEKSTGKVAAVAEKLAKSKTLSTVAAGPSGDSMKLKEMLKGKSIGEFNVIMDETKKRLGVSERELTRMIEEDQV